MSEPDPAGHVRELILTGRVEPGAFLRLSPLAAEIGTSVTPVREAMMHLVADGFVELLPHRGFRVLPLSADDVRDVYAVQAFVAGELAHRAVAGLSERDVDRLESIQERIETVVDAREVDALNHEFHRTINMAADSPRLAAHLRSSIRYAPRRFFATITGWPEASASDHRSVVDALRQRDAVAARTAMAAHIIHAGALLADYRASRQE